MQKELTEAERREEERRKEDNRKPKQPRNPEDDGRAKPDEEETPGEPRDDGRPSWDVNLPPQVRDAVLRGDWEMVPAKYRDRVRRYHLWLLEQERRERRGR